MAGGEATEPATLRRERIARFVEGREYVRVSELAERFQISSVTVRGDLDALAAEGRVRRVRGGALPPSESPGERPFEETEASHFEEKQAIARAAAEMVSDNDTVILDVGTTSVAIARALVARSELRDVVICTNGLNVALALEPAIPRFTVMVPGGTLRPLQHSLVDPLAGPAFEQLRVNIGFLGCTGVDSIGGVTNVNLPEADVKRRIIRASDRCVVTADSSKLGVVSFARVCDLDEVDVLITDAGAPKAELDALREREVDCRVVS
jgi:DeoR family transcriptional regulator of aga operon